MDGGRTLLAGPDPLSDSVHQSLRELSPTADWSLATEPSVYALKSCNILGLVVVVVVDNAGFLFVCLFVVVFVFFVFWEVSNDVTDQGRQQAFRVIALLTKRQTRPANLLGINHTGELD